MTASTYYTASGTQFDIIDSEDEAIDPTEAIKKLQEAVEGHAHETTRGKPVTRFYKHGTSIQAGGILTDGALMWSSVLADLALSAGTAPGTIILEHNRALRWVNFAGTGTIRGMTVNNSDHLVIGGEPAGTPIRFNDHDIWIDASGNVGIGLDPTQPFHVGVDAMFDTEVGFGDAPLTTSRVFIGGSYAPATGVPGALLRLGGAVTGAVDEQVYGTRLGTNIIEAASGTHPLIGQLTIEPPTVTGAGAAVTNAATVIITGPPVATVTGATYSLFVDDGRVRFDSNVYIGGAYAARSTTDPSAALTLYNGTAPVGTLAGGVQFYALADEARVMDAAGNSTLLSPHDDDNLWIFDSVHSPTGKGLRIDVERMLRALNEHFGWDFVHDFAN